MITHEQSNSQGTLSCMDEATHIDVRYHYLRDLTHVGIINLSYRQSEDQVVYILTKPFHLATFVKLPSLLGVDFYTTLN